MECPKEKRSEVLLDYCAGRLEPEISAQIQQHLAECDECRGFAESQAGAWSALNAFEAEPISPDFDRKLWARIEAEQGRQSWWQWLWLSHGWKPALSVALACLLLLVAVVLQQPLPAPVPQAYAEAADAEKIERALDDVEMLRVLDAASADEARGGASL